MWDRLLNGQGDPVIGIIYHKRTGSCKETHIHSSVLKNATHLNTSNFNLGYRL